jgi:NADPH:quinone reductase-like Zn-dependent oxidoreductase
MTAVLLDAYGSPEMLRVARVPIPTPGPQDVLIRMHATSLNGGDLRVRSGEVKLITGSKFPKGLGLDVVGVIQSMGPDVADWRVGDQVWGVLPERLRESSTGAYAEYVTIPADRISRVPGNIDMLHAAAMPVVATTAVHAVDQIAKVREGQQVLVRGASGGVGLPTVQLALFRGAKVTTLANASASEVLEGLGARAYDYRTTPIEALPRFDVVIDTIGSDLLSLRRLAPAGRTVTISLSPMLSAAAQIAWSLRHGVHRVRFCRDVPRTAKMQHLTHLVEAGAITPVVQEIYSLDQVAGAHRDAERGGVLGKRVIRIAGT